MVKLRRLPDDPRHFSLLRWHRHLMMKLARESVIELAKAAGRRFGRAAEIEGLLRASTTTKGRLLMWVLQVPEVQADTAEFMWSEDAIPELARYAKQSERAVGRDVDAVLGPLGSLEEEMSPDVRRARPAPKLTKSQERTRKRQLAGLPTIYESC